MLFVFIIALTVTATAAQVSMPAPAVTSDNKGLLSTIEVKVVPGDGSVWISTEPYVGVQTQDSERTAAAVAARKAGMDRNQYDFLYKIHTSAAIVDGPSAGAAMTLLAISALENRPIRPGLSVTGTIQDDGSVGAVGGIMQKAQAVHDGGLSVFVIPRGEAIQSGLDMRTYAAENWNMTIIEASTIDDMIAVALSTGPLPQIANQTAPLKPLNLTTVSNPAGLSSFNDIAANQISQASSLLAQLRPNTPPEYTSALLDTEQELNESAYLLEHGYLYSAANTAFLALIDLNVIQNRNATAGQVSDRINDLQTSIKNIRQPTITAENWEWIVSGQLRLAWAQDNLQTAASNLEDGSDISRLTALRDAVMSDLWIQAASEFFAKAEQVGGAPVSEAGLRDDAQAQINNATKELASAAGTSASWHLDAARTELADGHYAAAYYDASYALAFARADSEASGLGFDEVQQLLDQHNATDTGLWSHMYFVHSTYLRADGERKSDRDMLVDALRIVLLAEQTEVAAKSFPAQLAPGAATPAVSPAAATVTPGYNVSIQTGPITYDKTGQFILLLVVAIVVLLVLFAVVVMSRKKAAAPKPRSPEQMLEMLDKRLAEGWISEKTYERLAAKYRPKPKTRARKE